jgi:hypothetical protein
MRQFSASTDSESIKHPKSSQALPLERKEQLERHGWINDLAGLVVALGSKLPLLREIAVVVINLWWPAEEDR